MKLFPLLFVPLLFVPLLFAPLFVPVHAQAESQTLPTENGTLDVKISHDNIVLDQEMRLKIDFINPQTQKVQEHIDYTVAVSKDGRAIFGPIPLTHTSEGSVRIPVEFVEEGMHDVYIEVEGILFQPIPIETVTFGVMVGVAQGQSDDMQPEQGGGGCLIATATYGSELAHQVQQLRELRDSTVLNTESGRMFMASFNQVYYAFSPTVADFEREQPIFKEFIKVVLMPMLATLAMLDHANIDSEGEMLGYGTAIILLNIGMYVGIPAAGIVKLYRRSQIPQSLVS